MERARGALAVGITLVACGGGRPASTPAHHPHEHEHEGHAGASTPPGHHHRFEDAASWSKVFDDPARDAWQKPAVVVAALSLAPGMAVADVGAGTGYFEPHLSRAVGKDGTVLAVDIEPDMVRHLGERAQREGLGNVQPRLAKPDDPGLADGSVDRILVVDTWHHVDDRVAYARRLARALRPKGFVAIVDFTKTSPEGPPPAMRLAPEEVERELTAAGLRARTRAIDLPYQYLVVGERAE